MRWLLVLMFLSASFLFFLAVLQPVIFTENQIKKRMSRYLEQNGQSMEKAREPKKFNLILQVQLIKQKIRKQMMLTDKNTKLELALSRAGIPLKPEEYVMFKWIATVLGGGVLFLIAGKVLALVIGGAVGFLAPKLFVQHKQKKRIGAFNEGLPDIINTVIGALRAGFSFPQALKTVAEEFPSPIKEEIETLLREMQYGNSMENSLNNLKERMPSKDLDLMVEAILIQRNVGGNLATVLEKIVETIRERMRIKRQIQTLTAQGRLSGIVIGILPVGLGIALYFISPDYIGTLFTEPVGIALVTASIFFGLIGFIVILKITSIEV